MLPIVSGSGGKTNHRAVNGQQMNLLLILPFLGTLLSKLLRAVESSQTPPCRVGSGAGRAQRTSRCRLTLLGSVGEKLAALFSRCGSKRAGLVARTVGGPRAAAFRRKSVRRGKSIGLAATGSLGWAVRLADAALLLAQAHLRRAAGRLAGPHRQPCRVPVHRCTEARAIVHDRRCTAARMGPGSSHPIDWA
jgi:hypothetical protein